MSRPSQDPVATSNAVTAQLVQLVRDEHRLCLVEAPPGSGKTRLLVQVASQLVRSKPRLRVAVACQTNSQADDVCQRFAALRPAVPAVRFVSSTNTSPEVPSSITVESATASLPHGEGALVVATTAKWGLVELHEPFDVVLVDEAWQLAHKDMLGLAQVAERFVMIGDPGQIPPVVSAPSARWSVARQAPHRASPEVLRTIDEADARMLQLPATWRLPADSAGLIQGFYDFRFGAVAQPGQRAIQARPGARGAVGAALQALATSSMLAITLPTPAGGPPVEADPELAKACAGIVRTLLEREAVYVDGREKRVLTPADIGLAATHRRMVSALEQALPATLRGKVRVDTPERWQGLERKVLVAVHPLSGVTRPSEFDLETGRLCVLASRHEGGVVFVTRDHLGRTLAQTLPSARQPLGSADVAGRGHAQHLRLWNDLQAQGRVFSA